MIEEGELITLLIGVGALIFIIINYSKFQEIPHVEILIISFTAFLIGWSFTILEGFLFRTTLNFIEHLCYIIASIAITLWILKLYGKKEEDNP